MMIRSLVRYLPGLALAGLAGLLYTRAGYGPFGDAEQRTRPCELTRCAHNASILLVAALAMLVSAVRSGNPAAGAAT